MVCSAVDQGGRFEVAGLDVAGLDVASLDDADLLRASHSVELSRRRDEAAQAGLLIEIERRGLQTVDGHRGIDGWGRGVHRWSSSEAKGRKALVRLGRVAPVVLERLRSGQLGVAQAHLLGLTFCRPRIGELLLGELPRLLDDAASLSMPQFEQKVLNWRLEVDQDGADPSRSMRNRSVTFTRDELGFLLSANGPVIDGAEVEAILQRYENAEWAADWAWVRAEYGDAACESYLPRTRQQRRYDALVAIFEDAASTPPGATPNEPLLNMMMDPDTYAETIDRLFGDAQAGPPPHAPTDGARRYSQTTDGRHIPPEDVVLASLRGQIRRVLTDQRGIVLDMGRRRRLFTGANRQAVLLAATRCTHPGCLVASSRSQADHLTPFGRGGHTITALAGPACGHHNRWRFTSRSTTTLDDKGRWKTRRADGTDIAPPDHPHPPPQ